MWLANCCFAHDFLEFSETECARWVRPGVNPRGKGASVAAESVKRRTLVHVAAFSCELLPAAILDFSRVRSFVRRGNRRAGYAQTLAEEYAAGSGMKNFKSTRIVQTSPDTLTASLLRADQKRKT